MPPRAKKTNTKSNAMAVPIRRTSASGHRTSNKREVVDISDDKDSSSPLPDAATSEDVEDVDTEAPERGDSQPQSQAGASGLQNLVGSMMEAEKKRHIIRKNNVHTTYDKSVSDAKEAMEILFNNHEAESSRVHEAQLARLRMLLERKAQIEAQMQERVVRLRNDYRIHLLDLKMVVEERAEQLSEL